MLVQCAQAVQAAAAAMGRQKLTNAQLQAIDDRMSATMRRLARRDPARWRGLSDAERLTEAGQAAVADIQAEAALKADRAIKQVAVVAQTEQRLQRLQAAHHGGARADALKHDFELTHAYAAAVRREATGDLMSLIEAAGDKRGAGLGRKMLMVLFDAENRAMTRDIVREIFKPMPTATPATQRRDDRGARLAGHHRAAAPALQRRRRRHRHLDYGYVPQTHDTRAHPQGRPRCVGAVDAASGWTARAT
jgi:hypothetical protein